MRGERKEMQREKLAGVAESLPADEGRDAEYSSAANGNAEGLPADEGRDAEDSSAANGNAEGMPADEGRDAEYSSTANGDPEASGRGVEARGRGSHPGKS